VFARAVASRVEADGSAKSVHGKLAVALVEESEQLPKRDRASAPWYEQAKDGLEPRRMERNRAMALFVAARSSEREGAKQRVKEVRREWKKSVKVAKSEWIESQCHQINNECVAAFDCGKKSISGRVRWLRVVGMKVC